MIIRQVATFLTVGCAAALTHLATVALAVERLGLQPLAANAAGFCVAFCVSYLGHSRFTFAEPDLERPHAPSRFFLVALTGFAVNQTLYAYALTVSGNAYYLPILAAVLVLVAGGTFAASKLWAFAAPA